MAAPPQNPDAAHPLWRSLAAAGGRTLSDTQVQTLELYLQLLARANTTMNLTRLVSPEQGRVLHVADALTLLREIPAGAKRLADVGSGGGVPGLVLAAALPDVQVTLIESTGKKAAFLRAAATEIGLENVTVLPVRAEAAGHSTLREQCDIVTARAVGAMVFLAEWCLPLAKVGGCVLAMKGPKLTEELPPARQAIRLLGGGEAEVIPVTDLPGADGHVICRVPKIKPTPNQFPRAAETAKGRPL